MRNTLCCNSRSTWLLVVSIMFLQLFSIDAIASDDVPRFMSPFKYSGSTDRQKMAYSKGTLESLVFGIYSRVDTSQSDYQQLVDCYKEKFELFNTHAGITWFVLGENLNQSLAHNIYHYSTPVICRSHKYTESKIQKRTLKITNFTEWNTWTLDEKVYYVGGFLDAGITIMRLSNNDRSKQELDRLKRDKYDDGKLKEVVRQMDLVGLELGNPIPWSVATSFGKVFGNNSANSASKISNDLEIAKAGEISIYAFGKYVDFKILDNICKSHFKRHLSLKEQAEIADYLNSLKCASDQSTLRLIRPFLASQGLSNDKLDLISKSLNDAYDQKLITARSDYAKIGDEKTKDICIDLIRNNKYSEYVLADTYDVMKYQFERLQKTKSIFEDFETSTKSCPQIFSIGNKVTPPRFLQK